MAKKFSIAQAPTFESSVEIPRLGGESIKVPFTFKYLDREALADLYSSWGSGSSAWSRRLASSLWKRSPRLRSTSRSSRYKPLWPGGVRRGVHRGQRPAAGVLLGQRARGHPRGLPERLQQRALGKLKRAAQELYRPAASAQELAQFGLSPDDFDESDEQMELWPCNWTAFIVFEAMSTQWRAGMCGATGLDYTALPVVMQMCGVAADEQPAVFADIRVMEDAALRAFREQRESG